LNLRPSGYEPPVETPIEPDSPGIVAGDAVVVAPSPTPNPAIARAAERRTIRGDESEKARALLQAGLALLDVDVAEARRLFERVRVLLEPPAGNVVRIRERSSA
jgi:hypothetical protein